MRDAHNDSACQDDTMKTLWPKKKCMKFSTTIKGYKLISSFNHFNDGVKSSVISKHSSDQCHPQIYTLYQML